jgi:hypothetical protein
MAMSTTDELESIEEPVLRQFHPKPFRWDTVDPEKVVVSYDRRSDTLLVHLFGRSRDSISVPIERYLYAMVDPDSEQIVGIHIEGFLGQAVKDHPQEVEILDYAELRGMTPIEVWALQWKTLGVWRPLMNQMRAGAVVDIPRGKVKAISLLLEAEGKRWGIAGAPAA